MIDVDLSELRDPRWRPHLTLSAIATSIVLAVSIIDGIPLLSLFALPIVPLCLLHISGAGEREAEVIRRSVFRESPIAMGHMVISMQRNPSFEEALVHVSERGDGALSSMVRRTIWESMIDPRRGLTERLPSLLGRISEGNDGLVNGMQLLMAASREGTEEGRTRLLDKAYDMVLRGFKERMGSYASSLPSSLAMLFSLGILLPMVLLTMMPVTGMVSVTSAAGSFTTLLAPLFILVIPTVDAVMAIGIVQRNPMHPDAPPRMDPVDIILLVSVPVILASSLFIDSIPTVVAVASAIVPCALLYAKGRERHVDRGSASSDRRQGISSLYTLGNRLMSGTSLEAAMVEGDGSSSSVREAYTRARMLGTPVRGTLSEGIGSNLVSDALHAVSVSADSDSMHAGQMAVNLARYASDLESVRTTMADRIRETMDSMRNTSVVFAPIILGISSAMVGPLLGTGSVAIVMAIYLFELCLIISYLSEYVSGEGDVNEAVHTAALSAPIAMTVFLIASEVGRTLIGPLPI